MSSESDAREPIWWVYLVRCADGSLYTGIAKDVRSRVAGHNRGTGAKYTRGRVPVQLVYRERVGSRSDALRREYAIKRLPKAEKRRMIAASRLEETDTAAVE